MTEPQEYLVRFHGEHLRPAYQPGDVLFVREATEAPEGTLVVLVTNQQGDTRVDHYRAANGYRVIGIVTQMCRRIPGATNG